MRDEFVTQGHKGLMLVYEWRTEKAFVVSYLKLLFLVNELSFSEATFIEGPTANAPKAEIYSFLFWETIDTIIRDTPP